LFFSSSDFAKRDRMVALVERILDLHPDASGPCRRNESNQQAD
jgi:hypothetical protein